MSGSKPGCGSRIVFFLSLCSLFTQCFVRVRHFMFVNCYVMFVNCYVLLMNSSWFPCLVDNCFGCISFCVRSCFPSGHYPEIDRFVKRLFIRLAQVKNVNDRIIFSLDRVPIFPCLFWPISYRIVFIFGGMATPPLMLIFSLSRNSVQQEHGPQKHQTPSSFPITHDHYPHSTF